MGPLVCFPPGQPDRQGVTRGTDGAVGEGPDIPLDGAGCHVLVVTSS